DVRDVLVADPLDVVLAIAVVEEGRALRRLDRDDARSLLLLEPVARRERPRGARRRGVRGEHEARMLRALRAEDLLECPAGDVEVDEVVPELAELIEDDVLGVLV